MIKIVNEDYCNIDSIVAGSWVSFIRRLKDDWGFDVDSAYARKYNPKESLIMYKDGVTYEAEVTKYYDGTYELLGSNVKCLDAKDYEESYELPEHLLHITEVNGPDTDIRGKLCIYNDFTDYSIRNIKEELQESISAVSECAKIIVGAANESDDYTHYITVKNASLNDRKELQLAVESCFITKGVEWCN